MNAKLAMVYRQLIILNPENADAHSHLGDACFRLEKYEEAMVAYREAIRLNPKDSLGHYDLAKACLKVGKRDLALEQYQILKTLDEELVNDLNRLITGRNSNIQTHTTPREIESKKSTHKFSFKQIVKHFVQSPGNSRLFRVYANDTEDISTQLFFLGGLFRGEIGYNNLLRSVTMDVSVSI